ELLEEDRLVAVGRARAAVFLRPREAGVSRLAELAAPVAVGVLEAAGAAPAGSLREGLRDEAAGLPAARPPLGGGAPLHEAILNRKDAMELLRPVTEAEVIAEFLRAELDSPRYGARIRELLEADDTLVTRPDFGDPRENAARAELLDRHRGWLRREGLFNGLPTDIAWFATSVSRDELLSIPSVEWDWSRERSGGTRRPGEAGRRIGAGEIPGLDVGGDEAVAVALTRHATARAPAPRLIALAPPDASRLVLLEGPARL